MMVREAGEGGQSNRKRMIDWDMGQRKGERGERVQQVINDVICR